MPGSSRAYHVADRIRICLTGSMSVRTCLDVDRAALFQTATRVVTEAHPASIVALIDLAVDRRAEGRFIEAILAGSETAFATVSKRSS